MGNTCRNWYFKEHNYNIDIISSLYWDCIFSAQKESTKNIHMTWYWNHDLPIGSHQVVHYCCSGELIEQRTTLTRRRGFTYPTLNMHSVRLIPPNIFLGLGPLIVVATTFEFISAQSPQYMKGLLVGNLEYSLLSKVSFNSLNP